MLINLKLSRTSFVALIIFLVFILTFPNVAGAEIKVTKKQITDNSTDRNPSINNKGQVAFARYSGTDWDVYLYDNQAVIKINDNPHNDTNPDLLLDGPVINDNGQIVWSGYDGSHWQIYSYLNGTTTRITDGNHNEMGPLSINNKGEIVWTRSTTDPLGPGEIYLYTEGYIVNYSHDDGTHLNRYPHINDYGDVVWNRSQGTTPTLWEVVLGLHTTSQKKLITNDGKENIRPRINKWGQIVYESGGNIQLYSNGTTKPITTNGNNRYPDVNNRGRVIWFGVVTPGELEALFLYKNGQTTRITEYDYLPDTLLNFADNEVVLDSSGISKMLLVDAAIPSDVIPLLLLGDKN
ncbi:MAG: TolB family protein [Thermodesulfobacteriota bacterium]